MSDGPLWISEADVEALLDLPALAAAVEAAFAGAGAPRESPSTRLDGLDGASAYLTLYPAQAPGALASVKLLAGRPANAQEGRPEIDAVVALVDPTCGRIVALIAARALTAARTAAATTAVLRRLAPRAPARVGVAGTGGQALAHARALAAAGLASCFRIASPRGAAARADAAARTIAAATGLEAAPVSAERIGPDCDVVVLASLAARPVALGALRPDAAITSVGPFYPHAQELDPRLVAGAAFVVSDDPARLARQWSGSPLLDVPALAPASVSDLLAGRLTPPPGLRIFLSDGRGFQDNVAARMIFEAARAAGRGLPLP